MSTLFVFDFDDTLVHSNNVVNITHADGTTTTMPSSEYATYKQQPGDDIDYSDFDKYPENAALIEQVFTTLEHAISRVGSSNVVILTARGNITPVEMYLSDQGLSGLNIVGTGTPDPMAKAKYVLNRITNDDYDEVHVYEDSTKNLRTIRKVVEKTGVRLLTNRVVTSGRGTFVLPEAYGRRSTRYYR